MPGHPKHPPCPKCGKSLYKRMDSGSVHKSAPWAFCRNEKCELYGKSQAEKTPKPTAKPTAKASPELTKALKTLLPKTKAEPAKAPMKHEEPDQIKQARQRIREALAVKGTESKAVIGLTLALVAQALGDQSYANKLIDEFELSKTYGIDKQS